MRCVSRYDGSITTALRFPRAALDLTRAAWTAIHSAIPHRSLRCVVTYQSVFLYACTPIGAAHRAQQLDASADAAVQATAGDAAAHQPDDHLEQQIGVSCAFEGQRSCAGLASRVGTDV
jgi:hypothetical protein